MKIGMAGMAAAVGVALIAACGCVSQPAASRTVPRADYVIFIGFDGLSGRAVGRTDAPTFKRLMREGAWTLESRAILPSSSACNWHSIFTCSASEQHGYVDWNTKAPVFAPSATNEHGVYPDVFSELARQRPDAERSFVYEWAGMQYTVDTNAVAWLRPSPDWKATRRTVLERIAAMKPGFFAVAVNSPDDVGHGIGWDTPEYARRVVELDAWLGEVLAAIERAGIADRTVLVISSDHGGAERRHGRATLTDMERPVLIWGAHVRKGHRLDFPGTVYDTGATLAALLGLDFPRAWIGRPLAEAFAR